MLGNKYTHDYDDIIDLPHHQSKTRPHMSIYDRSAQFSPFAALTGYEAAVKEMARLTNQRIELSEELEEVLSARLTLLQENSKDQSEIFVTYFVADEKKSGGAYVTITGVVKRIDEYERIIIMKDQTRILIDDIVEIYGGMFEKVEV